MSNVVNCEPYMYSRYQISLEQQREGLRKFSESTCNQLTFFIFNTVDVSGVLHRHYKIYKNKSHASKYTELFPPFFLSRYLQTFDFSNLYTSIPHDLLKSGMNNIINNAFNHKNGATRYTHIKVGRNKAISPMIL